MCITSAGATGLERHHTSMAALVPSALPAMEGDVGITSATKVRKSTCFWFFYTNILKWNVLSTWARESVYPSVDSQRSETEDMNEVEKPQVPLPPRTTTKPAPKPKPSAPRKPVSKPSTPKPTTPRTPSSKTPSSTYLGIYRDYSKWPQTSISVCVAYLFSVFCFLQLKALSARPDCEISAEEQPATGQVHLLQRDLLYLLYDYSFIFSPVSAHSCLRLRRYHCPANCMNKKGKVWGTLFYDVVSLSSVKTTNTIHPL